MDGKRERRCDMDAYLSALCESLRDLNRHIERLEEIQATFKCSVYLSCALERAKMLTERIVAIKFEPDGKAVV